MVKLWEQNVKFESKRKSRDDFIISCLCFFTQITDSIGVLNK